MTTVITTTLASNQVTLSSKQLSQVIEQLKQDDSTLLQAYSEYAADNNYDSVYDNDDESINMMFADSHEALRAAFYGDYNHSHAYFTFNGYGNLQSFEYLDSDSSPIDIEELAQWIVDNDLFNEYNIEVTTLDDMLASIEGNITDDENLLKTAINYLGVSTMYKGDDKMADYNQYLINSLMDEIRYTDYETIKGVIDRLGINYE